MRVFTSAIAASFCSASLLVQAAVAQDRAFAFTLTGGAGVAPSYFGSDALTVAPSGSFGFTGLRFGATQWGDPYDARLFARGMGLRGVFRYIPKRVG